MATQRDLPHPEHPSTYVVQDRSNQAELRRLHIQDQMTTACMDGVLAEQSDPTLFQRVLDVGCGPGGWLIAAAQTYPTMHLLVGVDVSRTFVEDARQQAEAGQVSDRVEFHAMDALRMLEFPAGFFDLVNLRAGMSWLRTWDWRKLLQEVRRVTRVGGTVRVTEFEVVPQSTSPALTRLCTLFMQALYHAGHLFAPESAGITSQLESLLIRHGFEHIQTHVYTTVSRVGTQEWQGLVETIRLSGQTFAPFLEKWTRLPDDYAALCQQALREMQQPDFLATGRLLTAWGSRSGVPEGDPMWHDR